MDAHTIEGCRADCDRGWIVDLLTMAAALQVNKAWNESFEHRRNIEGMYIQYQSDKCVYHKPSKPFIFWYVSLSPRICTKAGQEIAGRVR